MATRLKFAESAPPAQPAPAAAPQLVDVYDPKTDQLMQAPQEAADVLAGQGYKVGPAAELEARVQGPEGKVAAFGTAALRGLSFGMSDAVMPRSLLNIEHQVREAHPVYSTAGNILGEAPAAAAMGPAGRIAQQTILGGMDAVNAQRRRGEPIYGEALGMGLGYGFLTGLFGEGANAAIKGALPAAHKAVMSLGKKISPIKTEIFTEPVTADIIHTVRTGSSEFHPVDAIHTPEPAPAVGVRTETSPGGGLVARQAEDLGDAKLTQTLKKTREPATTETMSGTDVDVPETWQYPDRVTGSTTTYQSPIDPAHLRDLTTAGALTGGVKGYGAAKGLRALNLGIPAYLNHGEAIGQAIDAIADGPMTNIAKTVQALFSGAAPEFHTDHDYDKVAKHVQNAAVSPEAVQAYIEKTYGPVMDYAPAAMGAAISRAHAVTGKLHAALPRTSQLPGILPGKPFVAQAAKFRFMGYYNGVTDFSYMLTHPTKETVEAHEEMNPELMAYARDQIMGHLAGMEPSSVSLRQKRILSVIMGAPLAPENTPEFLDKLHTIASTPTEPVQPVKPNATANKKASMRDAPTSELNQLE